MSPSLSLRNEILLRPLPNVLKVQLSLLRTFVVDLIISKVLNLKAKFIYQFLTIGYGEFVLLTISFEVYKIVKETP